MKKHSSPPYLDQRDNTLPGDEYFNGFAINRNLTQSNPYSRSDDKTPEYGALGIYDSNYREDSEVKQAEWINERETVHLEPHVPTALANDEKEAEFINEDKYRKRMKIRDLDNRVFDGSVHQPLRDRPDYKTSSKLRKIAKDGPFKYCCASIEIPNLTQEINKWQNNNIDNSIVDEKEGLEKDPHVTILWGLHDTFIDELNDIAKGFGRPIELSLGKMNRFNTDDRYDVLMVEINSNDLFELNKQLRKLPYTNTYSDYKPHLTIGYFKKGEVDKFIGNNDFEGRKFIANNFYISNREGKKTKIALFHKISHILRNII